MGEKILQPDLPGDNLVFADIAYGSHERQRLDLSIPIERVSDNGVILIIHGGGWVSCDKSAHCEDVKYWTSKGFITANMNYRYASPACHIPDMLEDISAALKAICSKCGENGLKITEAMFTGGSAGAHLCLMYAYTRGGSSPVHPVAAAVQCVPADLTPPDVLISRKPELEGWRNEILSYCCAAKITKDNIGSPDIQKKLRSVSPICYITPDTVPTLIAHGKDDDIVPCSQGIELHKKLKEQGVATDLVLYDRTGHDMKGDKEADKTYKELFLQYALRYLS